MYVLSTYSVALCDINHDMISHISLLCFQPKVVEALISAGADTGAVDSGGACASHGLMCFHDLAISPWKVARHRSWPSFFTGRRCSCDRASVIHKQRYLAIRRLRSSKVSIARWVSVQCASLKLCVMLIGLATS